MRVRRVSPAPSGGQERRLLDLAPWQLATSKTQTRHLAQHASAKTATKAVSRGWAPHPADLAPWQLAASSTQTRRLARHASAKTAMPAALLGECSYRAECAAASLSMRSNAYTIYAEEMSATLRDITPWGVSRYERRLCFHIRKSCV